MPAQHSPARLRHTLPVRTVDGHPPSGFDWRTSAGLVRGPVINHGRWPPQLDRSHGRGRSLLLPSWQREPTNDQKGDAAGVETGLPSIRISPTRRGVAVGFRLGTSDLAAFGLDSPIGLRNSDFGGTELALGRSQHVFDGVEPGRAVGEEPDRGHDAGRERGAAFGFVGQLYPLPDRAEHDRMFADHAAGAD